MEGGGRAGLEAVGIAEAREAGERRIELESFNPKGKFAGND